MDKKRFEFPVETPPAEVATPPSAAGVPRSADGDAHMVPPAAPTCAPMVVVADHVPRAVTGLARTGGSVLSEEFESYVLLNGGRSAVTLSNIQGLWILRVCVVRTNEVKHIISVAGCRFTPSVCACDEAFWLFTDDYKALEISTADWNRRTTHELAHFFLPGEIISNAFVVPGKRIAWVETFGSEGSKTRVIALDEGRVVRTFDAVYEAHLICGMRPGKIFGRELQPAQAVLDHDGSSSTVLDQTKDWEIEDLTVGPFGEGFLAARSRPTHAGGGLELAVFDAAGGIQSRTRMPGGEELVGLVTFPSERRTLVETRSLRTGVAHVWSYFHRNRGLDLNFVRRSSAANWPMVQDQYARSAIYVREVNRGAVQIKAVPPVYRHPRASTVMAQMRRLQLSLLHPADDRP